MIEVVWEFVVRSEATGQFELAYGPGGSWSKLLGRCPGYRGTTLLRDTVDPRRYMAIELWDTEDQREQCLGERVSNYAELDAALGDWTETTAESRVFRVLAEARVRPRPKVGRRAGGARGRRRKATR